MSVYTCLQWTNISFRMKKNFLITFSTFFSVEINAEHVSYKILNTFEFTKEFQYIGWRFYILFYWFQTKSYKVKNRVWKCIFRQPPIHESLHYNNIRIFFFEWRIITRNDKFKNKIGKKLGYVVSTYSQCSLCITNLPSYTSKEKYSLKKKNFNRTLDYLVFSSFVRKMERVKTLGHLRWWKIVLRELSITSVY